MQHRSPALLLLLGALASCAPLPTVSEPDDASVDRAPPPEDSPPEVTAPDTGPPEDARPDSPVPDRPVPDRPASQDARSDSPPSDSSLPVDLPTPPEDARPDLPPGACASSADCPDLAPWRCTSSGSSAPGTCGCTPAPVTATSSAECGRQDTDCDGHPDPLAFCVTPTGPRCADLRTDVTNCGRCGVACRTGETCTGGACTCPGASTGAARACSNGCFAFPDNASRCLYCARYCTGTGTHPDCCPWACAVTTNCGGR